MEAIDSFSGQCLKHAIVFKSKSKKYLAYILQSEMGKKFPCPPGTVCGGGGALFFSVPRLKLLGQHTEEKTVRLQPHSSLWRGMFTAPAAPVALWCRVLS